MRTELERVQMYARWVRCATGTADSVRAIKIGLEGLKIAGVDVPWDNEAAVALGKELQAQCTMSVDRIKVSFCRYLASAALL